MHAACPENSQSSEQRLTLTWGKLCRGMQQATVKRVINSNFWQKAEMERERQGRGLPERERDATSCRAASEAQESLSVGGP